MALLVHMQQTRDASQEGMRAAQMGDSYRYEGAQALSNQPDWVRGLHDLEMRGILDIAAAGDALFQEAVDRVIRVCHKRIIGAVMALEFRSWTGDAYHLNRQTPGPNGKWVDDTEMLTCDADLVDPDCGTADYVKTSFPFKFMLVCGSITRPVMARGRGFFDVLAEELSHAVHRAMYTLELAIFQGNFAGGAPKEFDGLFELVGVYNGTLAGQPVQVFTPPNAVGDAVPANSVSGDLDLNTLDTAADELKPGARKIWFTSKKGNRLINNLLVAQRQFPLAVGETQITVAGGFRVDTYDGSPIIKTDGIPDDMAWGLDGSGNPILTALSGATGDAATTAILAVDPDEVFIAELTPLTVEPMDRCTSQRTKFEAWWDGVLVLSCPEGATMIIGVKPEA